MVSLDHVQIAAPPGCEGAAREFFSGLLGLSEVPKPDALRRRGGVWFALGTQALHVGVEEGFSPARKAHPGLRLESYEFDAACARLRAAGRAVTADDVLPDDRRVYVDDPWGNRIELLTPR